MQPGEAANRRFPHGNQAVANRQHQIRTELQIRVQADSEADTAAREQAERERLETELGPQLDSLSPDRRQALLSRLAERLPWSVEVARMRPNSPILRVELLKEFSMWAEPLNTECLQS